MSKDRQVKAESELVTWTKLLDGDPKSAIDEYNRYTSNNTPVFLIGNFVDRYNDCDNLIRSNIITTQFGGDWNNPNLAGQSNILNRATSQNGTCFVGLPAGGMNVDLISSYVTNLSSHPAYVGFFPEDEPELTVPRLITPTELHSWWKHLKGLPYNGGPMHVNFLGASFAIFMGDPTGNNFGKTDSSIQNSQETHAGEGHAYIYPWLVADSYGCDTYPFFYTDQQSPTTFTMAARRASSWNYGLVASSTFGQAFQIRMDPKNYPNQNNIPPTMAEIEFQPWAAIAAGCSMYQWFEYHVPRPNWLPGYFDNLSVIGKKIKALEPAIVGIPTDTIYCLNEYDNDKTTNGVFSTSKISNNTNWVFAVNVKPNIKARYNGPFKAGEKIIEWHSNREIIAKDGYFEDDIGQLEWRAYGHKQNQSSIIVRPDPPKSIVILLDS
jgi:hypothetical protein